MFFQQQLLHILQKYDGQRTVYSAYHLLKGKKSGQTIQDVGLFDLQPYFYLLPKLTKENFLHVIEQLQASQQIAVDDDQRIVVLQPTSSIPAFFDGWHFRGGEHVFFNRLQLVVQSISNMRQGEKQFLPIVRDEQIQQFVKGYLVHIEFQQLAQQNLFINQLYRAIEEMAVGEIVRTILLYRLTGYGHIGMTWSQLAEQLEISELDAQLYFVHGLHRLIERIEKGDLELLHLLTYQVRVQTVLTESTQKTAHLLQQGLTMQQIAQTRRLKVSTIEDHIAELAMNDPHFQVEQFMAAELAVEIKEVILAVGSKKLKPIKEKIPHASYFQIRLILARVGGEHHA
ncbi:MAG: helix-turn-helix domain-containing protein [Kurthia sp.]|nr:helix-turn-helix domain-containing protein [Candidatus Kurthia equi]